MNCDMGVSGSTAFNNCFSRAQPNAESSVATRTHTESMVSFGRIRISATTHGFPLVTANESVSSLLTISSGCCRKSISVSLFTTKLKPSE